MAKCPVCGREFSTDASLSQHLKDKHGTEQGAQKVEERPEKARRKTLKKRNRHPVALSLVAVGLALGVGLYFLAAPLFAQPPYACIAEQNYYIHVHPYLQIWINGQNVTIPSQVGIVQSGSCLEPIHTHDSSGILHVELSQAESSTSWTLDNFFKIWSFTCSVQSPQCPTLNGSHLPVVFNQTDIMGFKADATHKVVLLIDGQPSTAWGSLDLEQYDYCSSALASVPPCQATAGGDPAWMAPGGTYPYGTGHKIVIEYVSV
ncbi:MAG TPA: hypothetical protein VFE91_01800 [Nitrososphaerales archaeon]|nr:hypothetical protein [Nitrososphaerales archaeon]